MTEAKPPLAHPYRSPDYGRSFASRFDVITTLSAPATWLRRPVDGTGSFDFAGAYPCISLPDYSALDAALDELKEAGGVSVVFVTNAFDDAAIANVADRSDRLALCRPFKTHHVVAFDGPWRRHLSAHHERELKAARKQPLAARVVETTPGYAGTFWPLYEVLIDRHDISGVQALGPEIIAAQCGLPGTVAVEIVDGDEVIASSLWVHDDREAHIHLHAQTPDAYSRRASYLLYEAALDFLSERVERVDLGGGAGFTDNAEDGLSRYKKGWSNATARTYLCGAILDPVRYDALTHARGSADAEFFPKYRVPKP